MGVAVRDVIAQNQDIHELTPFHFVSSFKNHLFLRWSKYFPWNTIMLWPLSYFMHSAHFIVWLINLKYCNRPCGSLHITKAKNGIVALVLRFHACESSTVSVALANKLLIIVCSKYDLRRVLSYRRKICCLCMMIKWRVWWRNFWILMEVQKGVWEMDNYNY